MRTQLTRRNFLRAGGVAIALPMMESFTPLARAAEGKKSVKRMVCLSNNYGIYQKAFFPTEAGRGYVLPPTLRPLEKHRKDFSVFSNLDHGLTGGHACVPTFLNGIRPDMASSFPEGNISMDQRAAEFVGAATRYSSMTLKVKESNQTSFTRTGVQVPAIDVTAMYRKLFLEESAEAKKQERLRLQRHGSILDTVMERAKALNRELGKQDQEKFAEYLDSVRGLEKKIDQQQPWLDQAKPKTEMTEPRPSQQTADEMKIMMELMALAIETDSTRVMTLSSGFANGDFGLQGGYHGFSHHGELPEKTEALKLIEGNQIAQMAYLIELLKGKEDTINGGTLFDHTMILFGCGMATGTHSCKNMPLVLAGGGFKLGDHRAMPEGKTERVKACNLLLSMLQNFGLEVDQFGTSTGTLTGLEWA
ncbi:DUF1552 domain-containing protein [Akkermansiaceae bacterium]|nr:DUF1552 domain-containing protein [Akkermansiaceae bacterium]|tara:strand:+ start:55 stop:1311 length:1257 start_codon:yes stop_codon:yes gene_type:complete